jgi:hypothetical protein
MGRDEYSDAEQLVDAIESVKRAIHESTEEANKRSAALLEVLRKILGALERRQ